MNGWVGVDKVSEDSGVVVEVRVVFVLLRGAPRSTQSGSSAASDVYKRQVCVCVRACVRVCLRMCAGARMCACVCVCVCVVSHIHISEPTRPY